MSANLPSRISRRGFVVGGAALAGIAVVTNCSSQSSGGAGTLTAPASTSTNVPTVADATTLPLSDTSTLAPATGAPAVYVNHGSATSNNVALTFHLGGDPALVVDLLDLMRAKGFTATLFAVGSWITANPKIGHRAVAAGHELGNHTLNHTDMLTLTRAQVYDEITGGGQALVPFIGSIGKWFRPSGTDVPSQRILDEAGRAGYAVSVGYDVDSRDFKEPGSKAVIAKVNAEVHPGAIVSMHFGHRDTIKAFPAILDHLAANNLTQVTVSGLLG